MNFEEKIIERLKRIEREVERLRVWERPAGGSGVTDHGALTGLADNDHPQYLLTTAKAADSDKLDGLDSTAFAAAGHDHDGRYYTETEVDSALALKADKTITLTAGNGLTGGGDLSANRTFTVGAGDGITVAATSVAVDSSVVRTSRTLTAGFGLTGGGDLSADRTFDVLAGLGIDFDVNGAVIVDQTENFNWTGEHTFTKYLSTASIYPNVSDTYDLGDYNRLWRKIWGSELSAIVFAQYTQVLLGGWFTVSKGEGIIPEAVNDTQTTINLGTNNFATNDIIVFRGLGAGNNPQIEYMKVGTLVSGTTYNVIRDLDGTGANAWPEGSVYGNWGQTGNGRVELNAYDTPRMSVYSQGMSYNDATEEIRIGDLYGQWGYNTNTYGAAFGSYETGKANITIDPTNGVRLRNYSTTLLQLNGSTAVFGTVASGKPNVLIDANGLYIRNNTTEIIKLTGSVASFENVIKLGTYARLEQGTGTWGSTFTGSAIWNDSGVMNVGGWKSGVKQWWGGSDGKLKAGGGDVILDENGIAIRSVWGDEYVNSDSIKFQDIGNTEFVMAKMWAFKSFGLSPTNRLWIETETDNATYGTSIVLFAHKTVGGSADDATVTITSKAGTIPSWIRLLANDILLIGNVEVEGIVGIGTAPVAGTALTVSGTSSFSGQIAPPIGLGIGSESTTGLRVYKASATKTVESICSDDVSNNKYGLMVINYSGLGMFYVTNTGNTYIAQNCSALTFTDRTPFYEGDALTEIKKIKGKSNSKYKGVKEIDHSTLPSFVRRQHVEPDKSVTEERDLGAMISVLTVAVQQLTERIEELEYGISS